VRANIILGDVLAGSGDQRGAIEAWKRIEQQNPEYLRWSRSGCWRATGPWAAPRRADATAGLPLELPLARPVDVAFQSTLDIEGADAAYKLVKDELKRSQTLLDSTNCSRRSCWSRLPKKRQTWGNASRTAPPLDRNFARD